MDPVSFTLIFLGVVILVIAIAAYVFDRCTRPQGQEEYYEMNVPKFKVLDNVGTEKQIVPPEVINANERGNKEYQEKQDSAKISEIFAVND